MIKNREIHRQLQKLNDLLDKTKQLEDKPIEFQSHWARYVCVFTAGFIENSVKELFLDYTSSSSSGPVVNYMSSTLKRIQNPKTRRMIEIMSAFKKEWGKEFEAYVNEDNRKDAIDSIMQNRHQISHGKDSGITINRLKTYLPKVIQVIEFTEKNFN